ncbi:MAG TPA: hypothetical protein VIM62_10625 [Acidobacteriaceae bacterium]
MGTAVTTYPAHHTTTGHPIAAAGHAGFLSDLAEDLRTTGQQMSGKVHSELFNKHLLAIINCYLALIIVLLVAMTPFYFFFDYRW